MWLIGRRPILDRDERITGYELLFGSPGKDRANFVDPVAATATVILGTLSGFGVEQILGEHQGFVNVDENLLFDDALELLPRESVVLELLESIRPTEAVINALWVPIDDLVKRLNLSESASAALVRREGPFGELLRLVEHLERLEVDEALDQIQALQMTPPQVLAAQRKAFAWRNPML